MPMILLVEDEPDVRESIQDILQASVAGAHVVAVATGEAAILVLGSRHVDVVVSDYKLPGMDGLRLLREALRLAPQAPRFLITGFADLQVPEADLDAARLEGIVTKPLEVEDLVARVLAALRGPSGTPGGTPGPSGTSAARYGTPLAAPHGDSSPSGARPARHVRRPARHVRDG